jgi:NAD(P)-dependent dehydrogenase (short-subunit alcohol dehydrogenase family)
MLRFLAVVDPLAQFRLDGEVAVVTGGAAGLGKAVADAFAAVGARVVVFDLAATGGDGYKVDVADERQVKAAFEDVVARHGRLDVLFNNAGIAIRRPTAELSVEDWNKVVAVNMTGVFLCAREAARHMLASGRGGRIVNTASIMGFSGGGLYPNISYQATKGAVVNMTRALAVEWAKQGIRVNTVCPAAVRTPSLDGYFAAHPYLEKALIDSNPSRRIAGPEEVAAAVVWLCSDAASYVTGHALVTDGGVLAQ